MMEMPPLPTSQANVEVWDSETRGLHSANAAYFTADQMLAYGESCARMAREEAARIAEGMEDIAGPTVHDVARAIRKG